MKQKITKGKVIQNCLAGALAVVVAGGVGFQFHENHSLQKDLNTLKENHASTVQELKSASTYNKKLEQTNKSLSQKTEDLTKDVSELQKVTKDLREERDSLKAENAKLKDTNETLNGKLQKERDYPSKPKPSSSKEKIVSVQQLEANPNVKPNVEEVSTKQQATKQVPTKQVPTKQETTRQVSTKPKTTSSSSVKRVINGVGTAYTASCAGCTGITASGKQVSSGMVAMDPSIPLGTKVRITAPGYGTKIYTVEDHGGAIHGNRVDIFMPNQSDAVKFGRRNIKIEILN